MAPDLGGGFLNASRAALSKAERDNLKQRAAAGDKAAAQRLAATRAYEAEKSRNYLERKKFEKIARDQEATEKCMKNIETAIEKYVEGIQEHMDDKVETSSAHPAMDTAKDQAENSSTIMQANGSRPERSSQIDTDGYGHANPDAGSQASHVSKSPTDAALPSLETRKRDAAEAEIKLKLEKATRKKARTALNKKLAQIKVEKEWLDDEDAETDLKLQLLRVQKQRLEEESANGST